jgi:hypothetical protein
MSGLFDDIFGDDDFELKEEESNDSKEISAEMEDKWDSGQKPDIWDAISGEVWDANDEKWTSDKEWTNDEE